MRGFALALLVMGVTVAGASVRAGDEIPPGWSLGGLGYQAGVDSVIKHGGRSAAFLRALPGAGDFGTLMQTIDAESYRGSRVRLSGYCKVAGVAGWAGFWMRVDGQGSVLAFDNMRSRPIKGTTDWQRYEVVLEVPQAAEGLAFGALLAGAGQVWLDDLQLEKVGSDVAVTAATPSR